MSGPIDFVTSLMQLAFRMLLMSDLFWLIDEQMAPLRPYLPKSHGRTRFDDRRVLSGIIFINRNGLRWRDAAGSYGPPRTVYKRGKRWSELGGFARSIEGLAAEAAAPRRSM